MIEIMDAVKRFDDLCAVDRVSLVIKERQVFGLVGTNGAGKSTLLRMVSGVMRADEGVILVDGREVFDDPQVKQSIFFIADDPYFFPNATPEDMRVFYRSHYMGFDDARYLRLLSDFGLDRGRRIATFSKGMKKQLAILLGVCSGTRYLLCDETFDGLDPVMRQGVKSLFAGDMAERGLTPVIASHNLRELEDICDHVGLLHRGGVLLSEELEDMKLNTQKVQCVFRNEDAAQPLADRVRVLTHDVRGRLHTFTIRGSREEVEDIFRGEDLQFFEVLPLTLEEVFISETEVVGYDIKKLILG